MYDKYTVGDGESLLDIANKFNTDVRFIQDINNIPYSDLIKSGMQIIVPKNREIFYSIKKIERGDSLYNVAKQYNINPELLANMNGLNLADYLYLNQEVLIPKPNYSYYITKVGDTVGSIADMFDITPVDLINNNETIYLMDGQLLVNKNK